MLPRRAAPRALSGPPRRRAGALASIPGSVSLQSPAWRASSWKERTGTDRVHRDAVHAPLGGKLARETDDAVLGRGVGGGRREARILAEQAGHGGDVDDA